MTKRLFETFRSIYTDDSSISFEAYSPLGGLSSRVLRIGGRQVVDMGNYCNTCSLLFQHLADPAQRVHLDAFADHLASGVSKREMFHVLDTIYPVLPQGAYEVSLLEMTPRLIHRGSSQDYFVTDRPLLWTSGTYRRVYTPVRITKRRRANNVATGKVCGDGRRGDPRPRRPARDHR